MDLLPKSRSEFSTKEYWESFFSKRENAFEWYGEYVDLCHLLDKYCKYSDKVLMSGCGNSNLSEEMYDVGYRDIVNIDISDVAIKRMSAKSKGRMQYLKMNVKEMTFDDGAFSVVLDKGTLDAIYSHDSEEMVIEVEKMFAEILRVLKVGGRYICVTLAQDHILDRLLSFFPSSCFVRVHEVHCAKTDDSGDKDGGAGSKLPVFVFVCTKMKIKLVNPVLEMVFEGKDKIEKFRSVEEIRHSIVELQSFSLVKHKMSSSLLQEEIKVDLWSTDTSFKEPRYTLFITDTDLSQLSTLNGAFAAFIVPNGRESNETFGTPEARRALTQAAGFLRLVICTLHRGHTYKDLDEIKADLSSKVMDFCPANWTPDVQVPFLSVSPDIGNRNVVFESTSNHNTLVIENVQSEEQFYYRQVVLVKNTAEHFLLAKTRLMADPGKKKRSKKRVADPKYLVKPCDKSILAGFSFLTELDFSGDVRVNVLVFGLQNTPFIRYLLQLYPAVDMTCVDANPALLDVYTEWFGLNTTDTQVTFLENDIPTFAEQCQETDECVYDVIIMDHIPQIGGTDDTCGFDDDVFASLQGVLKPGGVFMRVQKEIHQSCVFCNEDFRSQHFEVKGILYYIQYYLNSDTHTSDSLNAIWEAGKVKSAELVNRIVSRKPGFYDKNEWTLVKDTIKDLTPFFITEG